jgi:hypothetical protein
MANINTEQDYSNYFIEKEKQWEGLCQRCGCCCGAYDDPCLHLKQDKGGDFFCDIYEQRFGLRKSFSGEEFQCVPIKEILHTSWENDYYCSYKKLSKQNWIKFNFFT